MKQRRGKILKTKEGGGRQGSDERIRNKTELKNHGTSVKKVKNH